MIQYARSVEFGGFHLKVFGVCRCAADAPSSRQADGAVLAAAGVGLALAYEAYSLYRLLSPGTSGAAARQATSSGTYSSTRLLSALARPATAVRSLGPSVMRRLGGIAKAVRAVSQRRPRYIAALVPAAAV